MPVIDDEQADYGVSNDDDGFVVIKLGPVPELAIPPESAIKLAFLLLKHAGAEVEMLKPGKARVRWGKPQPNEVRRDVN
jgi:hypothetical protein